MPKRFGIARSILGTPLVEALRRHAASEIVPVEVLPLQLAEQLRQGDLDGAFVSPWEYAACYPTYRIVPAAGIVSEEASGLIALLYRQHARSLARIAAPPQTPTERALAKIVLVEKYEIEPEFHDLTGPWQEALHTADAVLVCDVLARDAEHVEGKIDLVDEWYDLTELPFLHGFWIVRDELSVDLSLFAPPEELPPGVLRTAPIEDDWNALREFYRMAFYHGIINDLPDLRFTGSEL